LENNKKGMNLKKNKKGFTLIELLIAVGISSLIMISIAGIFSNSIGGYRKARDVQRNMEDAQFIMNQIAKVFRMSCVISTNPSGSEVLLYDHSQDKCFQYEFSGDKIKTASHSLLPSGECPASGDFPAAQDMANLFVKEGRFTVVASEEPEAPAVGLVGKITMSMTICPDSNCLGDQTRIQTSVSLRDWLYYRPGSPCLVE
jgi:prepilin-type N-terminal cleavage/methylation domain-containing protein